MKIGIRAPLAGFVADAPVKTPVFAFASADRSTSVFPLAYARYAATAVAGSGCPSVHAAGVPSGHASATSASTSGCSGATTMYVAPDTVFGATYMVVAPEHPLVDALVAEAWPDGTPAAWTDGQPDPATAVAAYRAYASGKTDVERSADAKAKTGVFTGASATNPASGARIPIFIADYVLAGYGTGAIMAVPGQDERDWAFAAAYELPIVR